MAIQQSYDLIIVGAGASGLLAALSAARSLEGGRMALLEGNPAAGKKILATGNGRCNFLHAGARGLHYYSRSPGLSAEAWVDGVLAAVSAEDLQDLFDRLGLWSVSKDGWLYPRSMQAESLVEALLLALEEAGVSCFCGAAVTGLERKGEAFFLQDARGGRYRSRQLILATGGRAGPQYGSAGDGYRFAASLGHQVNKPIPGLTQLILSDWDRALFGVRTAGLVTLIAHQGGTDRVVAADGGEVQLTREGLSGICTFNVSRFLEKEAGRSYRVSLDFFPEMEEEALARRFWQRAQSLASRPQLLFLKGLLPARLATFLMKETGAREGHLCGSLTQGDTEAIAGLCKALERPVEGTKSWKEAQVTAGGVHLGEVEAGRLESRLVPGLFFAGELLDVDGPCGGYNLTWAFASGWAAGQAAAASIAAESGRSSPEAGAAPSAPKG